MNVPDTHDNPAVHDETLDRHFPATGLAVQVFCGEFIEQWFGAETA